MIGFLQPGGCFLQLKAPLALALGQKSGHSSHDIIKHDLQVFFHFNTDLPSPLKKDMRSIDDADCNRAGQAASKPEPQSGQDDWQVVKALKNVVQVVQMKRGQIMHQTDADDGEGQNSNTKRRACFHGIIYNLRY